ncbi:polysaccharide deacetylase family protein [Streptomyces sp. ACA25]|uniref:polysaccharide deacetylase family protein n=1 Tax=Streptomyces sp. ACA25 TaxID=3022596 RepID=UPI002307DF28|nr:polysaccharide deacetylase family protein [Streptomyces sp. ACA25]MDB1087945.1 polysaccharide deacetylase family protein [Streptomyces sp. ACA25]
MAALALLAVSCSGSGSAPADGADRRAAEEASSGTAGRSGESPEGDEPQAPDPARVGANELGAVPVLMYHQLIDDPSSVYDRTPEEFRAELERLAGENYVPVTAGDYSRGMIDIPAGTHPVVLTFDDSTNSQLALGPDGEPTPESAVGILLDVAAEHPRFRPTATFFVNDDPFSGTGAAEALGWLAANGFEIGNHTLGHANLARSSEAETQRELAANQRAIQKHVPGAEVVSLALPFGIMPEPAGLAVSGSDDGVSYEHAGVYLVGANPAPSPFADSFDAAAIPRIRSAGADDQDAEFGSASWLDRLADGTVTRYTSDGDPETVSYPEQDAGLLAPAHRDRARPYPAG